MTQAASVNPAETYEAYMVPALFRPWAERLLESAAPRTGERILDVACGTGIVARLARVRVGTSGEVAGIDVSPDMLAVARDRAEREALPVAWHEGRAEALPFPDQRFDLALCQFALMFFTDRPAALAEMRRVLTDGGRVALSVFQGIERHPFYRALDASIERHLGVSAAGGIFSLGDTEALEAMIRDAGFEGVTVEPASMTSRFPNPSGFLAGEIDVDTAALPAMQHLTPAERRQLTDQISADMREPLQAVTEGDHVVLDFHVLIASGRRGS